MGKLPFSFGRLTKKKEPLLNEEDMKEIESSYHEQLKKAVIEQVKIQSSEKAVSQARVKAEKIVYGRKGNPRNPNNLKGQLVKTVNKLANAGDNFLTNMETSFNYPAPSNKSHRTKKKKSSWSSIEDDFI